jgi:lysophospholipase L1-like esterase
MYPVKTFLAVFSFTVLVCLPQFVPALARFRVWDLNKISAVWDLPLPKPEVESGSAINPDELRSKKLEVAAHGYLRDETHELDHFYAGLLQSAVRPVRVLHYGDSPTTADLVTGDIRAMLQKEYGDGGSGFTLIARPWAWYNHRGVEMDGSGWKIDIAGAGEIRDGMFGLGGATFRGQTGASARWKLKDGRHRFAEVAYLEQPEGGAFAFEADDQQVGVADTSAEHAGPGFAAFELPEGSTRFSLRVTSGHVRLYGVEFRKAASGIVYSSLGINGASVTMLSRTFNAAHWAAELRHYQPDLVVLAYGTNESGFPKFVDSTWADEVRLAVRRLRAALPKTSILLMSPMDRGERDEQGEISTLPALLRLVRIEGRIAEESGVAFFNTFEAMGGEGTMGRWYAAQPRMVGADFIHPLPAGGKIVGGLLFRALQDGFTEYKLRQLKKTASEGAVAPVVPATSRATLKE